eukprot:TRINITY_DN70935_c0_g1_i1.p1 TRINITY_DN70935_c0_g1~~TRINITY_DN70935_c0_g1_i1.p1  ORF type:complete len:1572 (-),score=151.14 TRINITY_DN70935_c0_g1_i1:2181-6896(-)
MLYLYITYNTPLFTIFNCTKYQLKMHKRMKDTQTKYLSEKEIYSILYSDCDQEEIEAELKSQSITEGVCGKVIEKGGMAWRCPVCKKYDTAFICQECYQQSNHDNHGAKLLRGTAGGTCDCGDLESWSREGSCPAHSGFIDETTITIDSLPEKIRKGTARTLDTIMGLLNSHSLLIDSFTPEMDPKLLEQAKEETTAIIHALSHLAKEVSPIFLHMIALRFRGYAFEETVHKCFVRKFDSESEKTNFEKLYSESRAKRNHYLGSPKAHICTCTILENFVRIHHTFWEDTKKFINDNLFPTLMRNRSLKFYMSLAYFANYNVILTHDSYSTTSLCYLSSQFVGYSKDAEVILQTPEYMDIIHAERVRIINEIMYTLSERRAPPVNLSCQMLHTCSDIKALINVQPTLFLQYIRTFTLDLANLHVTQIILEKASLPNVTEFFEHTNYIAKCLENQFAQMICIGDLTDLEFARNIGQVLRETFEIIKVHSVFTNLHDHVIIFHRCCSVFITNYLLSNYWLDPISDLKKSRRKCVELLNAAFGFSSESELMNFATEMLKELLPSIGLFIRSRSGEWSGHWYVVATNYSTFPLDSALAIILISLLKSQGDLLSFLLKLMHPEQEDIKHFIDLVVANDTKTDPWERAASKSGRSKEKLKQIIENSLYTIACWLSNDILYYPYLRIIRGAKTHPGYEKSKKPYQMYADYAVGRSIVQLYLARKEHEKLTKHSILNYFPEGAKDSAKVEEFLRKNATAKLNPVDNLQEFSLSHKCLCFFDPFLYPTKGKSNEAGPRALSEMERIQSPERFDYLFGELSKESYSKETLLIPFKGMLRETFARSGTMQILKVIVEKDTGKLTPWILRCSLKLLISALPYVENEEQEAEIRDALTVGFEHLLPNENEDTESLLITKYKISLKCNEGFPVLKKQTSEEERAKLRQLREKIYDEFRWKTLVTENDSSSSPRKLDPSQASKICSYCQNPFDPKKFDKKPYGALIFIQKSWVFDHHLRKTTKKLNIEIDLQSVTNGIILSACGHYIHNECMLEIQNKPVENTVAAIDAQENKDYFLCPVCQLCANSILPPAELIQSEEAAVKYAKEKVLNKMWRYKDPGRFHNPTFTSLFKMLCEYITYELNIDPDQFESKKMIVIILVNIFKALLQKHVTENLPKVKERIERLFKFMYKKKYKLFDADLVEGYVAMLLGSKMIQTVSDKREVYNEVKEKTKGILKMYMMQVVLKQIYEKVGYSYEAIYAELYNKDNFEQYSDVGSVEKVLVAFLKKLLAFKEILYPSLISASLKEPVKYYVEMLDLITPILPTEPCINLPKVDKKWMKTCWKSLLHHIKKQEHKALPVKIPKSIPLLETTLHEPTLIEMAVDFDEMQKRYINHKCSACGSASSDTAVCLICGDLFCFKKEPEDKKQKGKLTTHSLNCPGGCGMFLRFINNKVFLVDSGQVCCFPSPYVNRWGESVDIQKSGEYEPLKLENKILNELKEMYVSHRVKQSIRALSLRSAVDYKEYSFKIQKFNDCTLKIQYLWCVITVTIIMEAKDLTSMHNYMLQTSQLSLRLNEGARRGLQSLYV